MECPNCKKKVAEEEATELIVKNICAKCLALPEKAKEVLKEIEVFSLILLPMMFVLFFCIFISWLISKELTFVIMGLFGFAAACTACLMVLEYSIENGWVYGIDLYQL